MSSDLEELIGQNPPAVPAVVRFLIAGLLGAVLAVLVVASTSPFSSLSPDRSALFDDGFALGSAEGEAELGQRVFNAGQQAYFDGIREAAASSQGSQSLGNWLRDSLPQVNAAILTSGTATDDFQLGYQDGLQAALNQSTGPMETE